MRQTKEPENRLKILIKIRKIEKRGSNLVLVYDITLHFIKEAVL